MAIIGIDLGTTNSLAAVWKDGACQLIPNASGAFLTPSAVSVDEDGSILVGRAAKDRLISHPERTAARFKRYMGTDRVFQLGEHRFTPEELSALILRSLKEDAEAYLGEAVTEAVISVPAYFAEPQRSATKRAGQLAGLRVERLVNEPTAAAMSAHIAEGEQDKVCLVFDFGGGTLDVSLVERFESVVSVTAVSGDNNLGGTDFDLMIAKAFCRETGIDFGALSRQKQELLVQQAETCKMALSAQEPVFMAVENEGSTVSLPLTNQWLIRACGPLFQRMKTPIRQVLSDAGMFMDELDELVMVGGLQPYAVGEKLRLPAAQAGAGRQQPPGHRHRPGRGDLRGHEGQNGRAEGVCADRRVPLHAGGGRGEQGLSQAAADVSHH